MLVAALALASAATPVAATTGLPPRSAGPPLLHAPPPRVPELENTRPWRAAPLLVSGTDAIRAGEYVHQDHLIDDRGADTVPLGNLAKLDKPDPTSTGDIAASTGGDVRYPRDPRYAGNSADIAELRLRPVRRGRAVAVRVTFRTAVDPAATVVALGLDLDRSGGAPVPWPRGAGVATPGLDAIATAWGTGGELQRTDTATAPTPLAVRFDLERNQMSFTLPLPAGRWRVVAGAGLWDGDSWTAVPAAQTQTDTEPASGSPLRAAPAVFDLAFSFAEPIAKVPDDTTTFPGTGNWLEERQSRWLADGTTGDAFADVDLLSLARDRWLHAPGRIQARVLGSGLAVHEGVRSTFPEIGSRLVPYLLVHPQGIGTRRAPAGLTFALHSFGGTYTQHAVFSPNMLRQFGDERGHVVVTPSSRSLGGGYAGEAEADVFEIWRDLARSLTLDPDRAAISGYSMGGFGTYRLAAAYPDLFGTAFTGVGPAGTGRAGDEQNVRWVPFLNWAATADELVMYDRVRAAQGRMVAAGMPSQLWTFQGEHFTIAIQDEWGAASRFLGDARVHRDPWRVTYAFTQDDARPALKLDRSGAYWVGGLVARDPKAQGRVDARSLVSGERDAPAATVSGTAVGLGGFPTGARVGEGVPAPAIAEGLKVGPPVARATPERALELDLVNVVSGRLDLRRAGVRGRGAVTLRIRADGPGRLRAGRGVCAYVGGETTCRVLPSRR